MNRFVGAMTICLLSSCTQSTETPDTVRSTTNGTTGELPVVESLQRQDAAHGSIGQEDRESIRAIIQGELSENLSIHTPITIQTQRIDSGDVEVSWSIDERRGPTAIFRKVNGQWNEISSRWSEADRVHFEWWDQLYFSSKAREISRKVDATALRPLYSPETRLRVWQRNFAAAC